jgi:FKBP-type peptidyl-prolyl cis-trans isomerase SlyD
MSNDPEGDVDDVPADDTAEDIEEQTDKGETEQTDEVGHEAAQTDDESERFEYGDFVRIEYVARTAEDDHLVDTTDGELAQEEGIDEGERDFGPRTIVLGQGHIFDPVEEALVGTEVGDSGTASVPPGEAFGEYDDDEVRTVSKDKIPEDDRYPGNRVQIDGDTGFVETIIGGRARVDFNHPLAGDTLEYEWEVVGTVEDREERARDLLRTFLDIDLDVHFETDIVEEERLVEDDEEEADADGETDADDDAEADAGGETDADDDAEADAGDETDADDDAEADAGDETDADDDGEDNEAEGPTYETVEVEKESLYIDATMELMMNQQWMMRKQQIGQQLIDLLDIDRIVVQDIIEGGGLPGMMGGMGGMGGGGGGGEADLEAALEDADIDADDLAEEL